MATAIEPLIAIEPSDTYEVVNGEIIEVPPMSFFASEIANRLNRALTEYSFRTPIGRPRMDVAYRLRLPEDPKRERKPDVAFATLDRWADDRPIPFRGNAIDLVPNLAVEVVSPTDAADDVLDKAFEYLRAGVSLVWVIYPRVRQLHAYGETETSRRIFRDGDIVEAPDLLPGFGVPLAALFPPLAGKLPPAPADK